MKSICTQKPVAMANTNQCTQNSQHKTCSLRYKWDNWKCLSHIEEKDRRTQTLLISRDGAHDLDTWQNLKTQLINSE